MFEPMELTNGAVIKAIDVGDGGGDIVEHMVHERIEGVEFFTMNIDTQALRRTAVGQTIRIGSGITKGLDVDADPEVGRNATDEDREVLRAALDGADTVPIAAGMGGGTGASAAPVIAEVTRGLDILTVAVVTRPFNSKGKKRMASVEQSITELSRHMNFLITIPNDKLLKMPRRGVSLPNASGAVNDMLKSVVRGIAELITRPGLMNIDFADVRTVISKMGCATMGSGMTDDEDCTEEAAEMAISSPLLEDIDLSGVRGVLVNITTGFNLRLGEFEAVSNAIRAFASNNATVAIGTSLGPDMNDELRVIVVATRIGMDKRPEITLMTSKQVRQPVMDRYQRHGIAPLTQERKPVAKMVSDSTPQITKEPDYLGIPVFLRKQTD